jgi:hypothetical protein
VDLGQNASDWQVCLIGCIGYGMMVAVNVTAGSAPVPST